MRPHLSRREEFIIGNADPVLLPPTDGQVDYQRTTHDIVPWDKAPVAAVRALIAVIAHDKVASGGHFQLAIAHKSGHLVAPRAIGAARVGSRGKVIAEGVAVTPTVDHILLLDRLSIHVHHLVAQMEVVSWHGDDTLDEVHRRLNRITKNNDIATLDVAIREHAAPRAGVGEVKLI